MDKSRKRKKISDGIKTSGKISSRPRAGSFGMNLDRVKSKNNNDIINIKKRTKKSLPIIIYEDEPDVFIAKKKKNKTSIFFILNRKKIKWILYILIYLFLLFFIFSMLNKTEIKLIPRTESIVESKSLNVYSNPKYNELGFDIIALSGSLKKTLTAGESILISEKASGTIRIFNNYSKEPQRLSPETRFESVSGKIFKLDKNGIKIPGKLGDNPGSIDVIVYAEKPGPEYNIDLTDFTIPGFKEVGLDKKYENIYALSVKSFSGGFTGESFVVGDEQQKNAILELESELKSELVNRLDVEKTDKVLLVNDSIQIVFKEPNIENIDEQKVILKQDAKIFALLIKKTKLEKYLRKAYFPETQKDDLFLLNFDNINFRYKDDKNLNFSTLKKVKINMDLDSLLVWNIDTNLVKESLVGLPKNKISIILQEFDEIDSARIKIEPFWRKNISDRIDDLKVKIIEIKP